MIVNNIQLNKFFAKAQQATQVVELTLTYEDHTQERNSYLLSSSYTSPIQIPTKSHFRLFYEADLERT